VVNNAVSQPVLGVAGKLPAVDGQVVAAVEGGGDSHLFQCADHRGDVLAKLDLPGLPVLDEGKLPEGEDNESYYLQDVLAFFASHDNLRNEQDYEAFAKNWPTFVASRLNWFNCPKVLNRPTR
jgi:hypothetical protein